MFVADVKCSQATWSAIIWGGRCYWRQW